MTPDRAVRVEVEGQLATLASTIPLQLLDISQTGCLLAAASRVEAGATGRISVVFNGHTFTDEVRITRCQRLEGSAGYRLGAEFLRTRRPRPRSLRVQLPLLARGRQA